MVDGVKFIWSIEKIKNGKYSVSAWSTRAFTPLFLIIKDVEDA